MILFFIVVAIFSCETDFDCLLNGICANKVCECNKPWNGDDCGVLNIIPRDPNYIPAYGYDAKSPIPNTTTSWGGNIIESNGVYHLFVSEMKNGLGLSSWGSNSQIVHAISSDPMGVFKKQDVSLPSQAHNASPIRGNLDANGDAPWYIFHIGNGGSTSNTIHISNSPSGPWKGLPDVQTSTNGPRVGCNNPAPAFHVNGTLYLLCNSATLYATDDVLTKGSWRLITHVTIPSKWGPGTDLGKYLRVEDPYLFLDAQMNWHLLYHYYDYRCGIPKNPNQTDPMLVSGHAYSKDGLNWEFSLTPPYNAWVDFTDGSRQYFATFERPHLLFDSKRNPTHLVNGVSPVWPCVGCERRAGSNSSCVVCKTSKGLDWTYTLVSPLG